MKKLLKMIKFSWRQLTVALVYAIYLTIGIIGAKMDYFTSFMLQCMVFTPVIGYGLSLWLKSARKLHKRTDSKFFYPTTAQLVLANDYAGEQMCMNGQRFEEDYISRTNDCDDHSEGKCYWMKKHIREHCNVPVGVGIGIAPFAYVRKDGEEHVIVECIHQTLKGRMYFESYEGFGATSVNAKEFKARQWDNF